MRNFDVDALRLSVKSRMDEWRYTHTLGVEEMAARLGELYIPKRVAELRCAALLHDITKCETTEKQLQYCSEFGIILKGFQKMSPKLLHAMTGAEIILREYPEYATDDIVSAVRWHTTGRDGMSMFEGIVYLADYIEEKRAFKDCVCLREYFWGNNPLDMTASERLAHFYKTMVMSVDLTVNALIVENAFVDKDTIECRNYYLELALSGIKTDQA